VLVALSSRGPNSEKLLRYASRLAGRLNRSWYAIYVQTPSEEPVVIDSATQRMISDTLTLAKQLGAIVFTFKGEDVAQTILQFAKEYRVGHIILGSPEKLPLWKRMIGRQTISEQLAREAEGVAIVVLDTKSSDAVSLPPVEKALVEELPSAPQPSVVREGPPELNSLLSPDRIVIWDAPVDKETVLCDLTAAAERSARIASDFDCLAGIRERELQGSTFMNEGVAFPHARIKGLPSPVVSLGLTREGISDVTSEKPIGIVFLILTPEEDQERQVQILSVASRAALDRQLVERLGKARTPGEAYLLIQEWEAA
jgi:two-component system sensor histidine kinase KdpD